MNRFGGLGEVIFIVAGLVWTVLPLVVVLVIFGSAARDALRSRRARRAAFYDDLAFRARQTNARLRLMPIIDEQVRERMWADIVAFPEFPRYVGQPTQDDAQELLKHYVPAKRAGWTVNDDGGYTEASELHVVRSEDTR